MAQKFTIAAHLWRENTHIEFRVKRWHKKFEILNYIERHNFHLNYMLISPHVRESGFRNPRIFCLWNPESWALESGILLKIGIRNPTY